MDKISLIVVDDHPLFRQGVVDVFAMEDDLSVVGEAADGKVGLEMIQKLNPDIAVIDVNLPELNGQYVTRQLAIAKSKTKVLLLTAYNDSSQAIHSISAGASAYCPKDIAPEMLVEAVRAVAMISQLAPSGRCRRSTKCAPRPPTYTMPKTSLEKRSKLSGISLYR